MSVSYTHLGLEILGIVRKYMAENQLERPEIMDMLISDNREAASRREAVSYTHLDYQPTH